MSPSPAPDAHFYSNLGVSCLMMGQYKEAIAAFKMAISLWAEFVGGHIGLTASYSLAGLIEGTRAQAAEVLKINPKFFWRILLKAAVIVFRRPTRNALSTLCARLV